MPDVRTVAKSFGPVTDPVGAERFAAQVMVAMGFEDARVTTPGADGGLDVVGHDVVAQVKYQSRPVGRPTVQKLAGAAAGRRAFFFASGGYSAAATQWASENSIATITFDSLGSLTAANDLGDLYLTKGSQVGELTARESKLQQRVADCSHELERVLAAHQQLASRHRPTRRERHQLKKMAGIVDELGRAWDKINRITAPTSKWSQALGAPFQEARLESAVTGLEQALRRARRTLKI